MTAYIGGGHNLQSTLLCLSVWSGKSLPGVRYHIVRGSLDASGVADRRQGRSKYGSSDQKIKVDRKALCQEDKYKSIYLIKHHSELLAVHQC